MQRIFISHAKEDTTLAEQFCTDLRNVGHDVSIDTQQLGMGSNVIDFMNEGLGRPVLIILHSASTPNSIWQKREVDAATWNDVADPKAQVFVICVDDTAVPPLLRPKIYGNLRNEEYIAVLGNVCKAILPKESASSIISDAFREDSPNPFWRLRAEYFEETPAQLAAAFSQPSADKIGALEDVRPSLIEGSRGTGKTMLLMSLRARHLQSRKDTSKKIGNLFGFYLRLTRGAFCNSGIVATPDGRVPGIEPVVLAQVTETFSQELFVSTIESLIGEVAECAASGALICSSAVQAAIVRDMADLLGDDVIRKDGNFESILSDCARLHRSIAEFTKRKFIYGEAARAPIASLDLNALRQVLRLVRRNIPELKHTQFALLLDEYENLLHHQKIVINDIVKLGAPDLSVKIAKKVGTAETSETLSGQELQEIHDYARIPLVYSVEDGDGEFGRYKELLEKIVRKTLASSGGAFSSMDQLLPDFFEPEFAPQQVAAAVEGLIGATKWEKLSAAERNSKIAYYGEAALYRLTYGQSGGGREKHFAGFNNLAFLSSGVIRYFQEIVGLAFYLQRDNVEQPNCLLSIKPENQTRAVHLVSEHNLSALSRNVERHGEQLKYLLLDLGDMLRWKLLKHSSEPEAGRLALIDADSLMDPKSRTVDDLITLGVREGVFQIQSGRPGMRPKHVGDPQPVEFNISRVFSPVLQFSPRFRWKTNISCADLIGLLTPHTRASTKTAILRRISQLPLESQQPNLI